MTSRKLLPLSMPPFPRGYSAGNCEFTSFSKGRWEDQGAVLGRRRAHEECGLL